jgi:hypothetical protein
METKSFDDKYAFGDDEFGCKSQNFTSLDKVKVDGTF